jgi:hypothetical protein
VAQAHFEIEADATWEYKKGGAALSLLSTNPDTWLFGSGPKVLAANMKLGPILVWNIPFPILTHAANAAETSKGKR